MSQDAVVVCGLTSDLSEMLAGSTTDTPCDGCGRLLVLSPTSQTWLATGIARLALCFDCAAKAAKGKAI